MDAHHGSASVFAMGKYFQEMKRISLGLAYHQRKLVTDKLPPVHDDKWRFKLEHLPICCSESLTVKLFGLLQ